MAKLERPDLLFEFCGVDLFRSPIRMQVVC
jgi:hypothetical protein